MEFTNEVKADLNHTINHLKKLLDNLSNEIEEISSNPVALEFDPALFEIVKIESELGYVKGVLKENQDLNVDDTEFP